MKKLTQKTKNTLSLYLWIFYFFSVIVLAIFITISAISSICYVVNKVKETVENNITVSSTTENEQNNSSTYLVQVDTNKQTALFQHTRYDYKKEIEVVAKVVYREARGIKNQTEQANIVWTILNRVDNKNFANNIIDVVTAPYQFAYIEDTPTVDDYGRDLKELAKNIIFYWAYGLNTGVIRTLPEDYFWYYGDNYHNHFSNDWDTFEYWCRTKKFINEYDYHLGYLKNTFWNCIVLCINKYN